jgi:hypothetical protein
MPWILLFPESPKGSNRTLARLGACSREFFRAGLEGYEQKCAKLWFDPSNNSGSTWSFGAQRGRFREFPAFNLQKGMLLLFISFGDFIVLKKLKNWLDGKKSHGIRFSNE